MAKEIRALEDNGTWVIRSLPPDKKSIRCKWMFKWEMHQLDVNNAFLHGDLDEEVYMSLPPSFCSAHSNHVCHLRKSLYGLRQASRNWYSKFATTLIQYGFQQSEADHSLFTFSHGNIFHAVLVYVDDMILVTNDSTFCAKFKDYLHQCFRIKDLDPLSYFLGIEIIRSNSGLFLNQRKYTLDILTEARMLGSQPAYFPMEQQHQLSQDNGAPISEPGQYRHLVG
ncbi:hypothetical protein CRG98_019932 [Punica granatum]|uniref:Reverse transcriptase Ty1/copia-type domain-containing protein n=1 Tax=Punica granatum TaxID=22663 RepID=A0A2I0JUV4_PUNGR|nr:hypothetical protein CRG98_019932 [Punica granatum]